MFESCLRNFQKPESKDFGLLSFCCGKTLHMLPAAVLRKAKRPFGPSASFVIHNIVSIGKKFNEILNFFFVLPESSIVALSF